MSGAASIALPALTPNALAFALFGLVALAVILSLVALASRGGGSAYDQIGRGGLSCEGDHAGTGAAPAPDSPQARAERELEIRQMLVARSERLVRRGRPALDVDGELARLLDQRQPAHTHDAALVAEIRQLVGARNERRARQGLEPLDVDSEVTRTLEELQP
ncbi:MAG: hypothetical protein ACRDJX_11155 [Solirubrobacteraceae bacterium]